MAPVSELVFRRTAINLRDAARLGEGEDLNDALLDFFIKLGQALIPKGGDDKAPVAYLGSLFFKQLTSAFGTSGEEGWKHVQNWAKRKAGGLFKPTYAAFSVPINEDLKDEKGNEAGNHWWLALVLNPPGGAKAEPTSVMVLDSMQRREKQFTGVEGTLKGTRGYTIEVTKMEQAGYLVIVSFIAKGDGSAGPLQRPEASKLYVENIALLKPELGLKINMGGGHGTPGIFEGTLTFALDGRVRSSSFRLDYGEAGYSLLNLEFDPFVLTKMQKNVSRFLGGYLAKEWETNGPAKKIRFEKQSARALVADVYQQENLNDCGVFVLENTLRSISMKGEFLKSMAGATPAVLKSFPWPSQEDITARKEKLKAITARMFSAAADKGTTDLDLILKGDADLRAEVLASLTDLDASQENMTAFAGSLQKELAARQQDKDAIDTEKAKKDEQVQARKLDAQMKKDEEARQMQEDIKRGIVKALPKVGKRRHISSNSGSRSRSRSRSRSDRKKKAKVQPKKRAENSEDSDYEVVKRKKSKERNEARDATGGRKERKEEPKQKKRRNPSSRSASESPPPKKKPSRRREDSRSASEPRRRRR